MSTVAQIIPFPARQRDGQAWEPWLDEQAIARHYQVSTRTVRRWRTQGCPSTLIGGNRRYKLSIVETWHQRAGQTA